MSDVVEVAKGRGRGSASCDREKARNHDLPGIARVLKRELWGVQEEDASRLAATRPIDTEPERSAFK
jgi:hypothetical protein